MSRERVRPAAVLFTALALCAGAAPAQEGGWRPFFSITPAYEGKGDLDGGGDFRVSRAIVRGGVTGQVAPGVGAGVTLNYDYNDYSFSNPVAFGGVAPWNVVQRYGVAVPLAFELRDGWSIGFTPSADWFRENGASTGDALSWGAAVSAVKRFADGNRLGLGVGIYDRIEETSAFPFVIVDWRLSDRWRLTNPLPAGPTGPAGLELDYRLDADWSFGFGGAWRRLRFRLSESGPVPNGVGEDRGLPFYLRATRSLGPRMSLHLFAGAVFAGEMRVEDPDGNLLRKVDYDPAPFVGATLTARF
jgi:hypothetical protein